MCFKRIALAYWAEWYRTHRRPETRVRVRSLQDNHGRRLVGLEVERPGCWRVGEWGCTERAPLRGLWVFRHCLRLKSTSFGAEWSENTVRKAKTNTGDFAPLGLGVSEDHFWHGTWYLHLVPSMENKSIPPQYLDRQCYKVKQGERGVIKDFFLKDGQVLCRDHPSTS